MKNVQDKLGLKNISDLLRKEMCGKLETNDFTEKQKKQYLRSEYQITKVETDNKTDRYAKNDIIEKIIKNCRGVKNVTIE